jgi:hypothetical protein
MLRSKKPFKFIYIHVPKTGGSSVTSALAPYLIDPKPVDKTERKGWQIKHHVNKQMHHPIPRNMNVPDDFFIFGFVRNPYERLVSSWGRGKENNQWPSELSFSDFVLGTLQNKYAKSLKRLQEDLLETKKGRIDFIGRYESLQEDWAYVTSQIGLPDLELPHKNKREEKEHYSVYYTDKLVDAVTNFYKKDIELFGYSFETQE